MPGLTTSLTTNFFKIQKNLIFTMEIALVDRRNYLRLIFSYMIRIDPSDWLDGVFANSNIDFDLLRYPVSNYEILAAFEKDKVRQTQIFKGEVIRILGSHDAFYLVMKFDRTIGWVDADSVNILKKVCDFIAPTSAGINADDFLREWIGVEYLFGGISKKGIDCSGFTQKYSLDVLGRVIPKNSRDQRNIGQPKDLKNIQFNDLAFCHRKGSDLHHVVLYFKNRFWHARPKYGVVSQSPDDFYELFEVESVATL